MNEGDYKALNADLGAEFDLFAFEHPEWMTANVPEGAVVVMQTDDADFNKWARDIAERNRSLESPARSILLILIRELRPTQSRIVGAEAELLRT